MAGVVGVIQSCFLISTQWWFTVLAQTHSRASTILPAVMFFQHAGLVVTNGINASAWLRVARPRWRIDMGTEPERILQVWWLAFNDGEKSPETSKVKGKP
jgi:hypothetical protein